MPHNIFKSISYSRCHFSLLNARRGPQHNVHKVDGENIECNKDTVREWCSGKVFYGIKDMATLGGIVFLLFDLAYM